MQLQEFRAPEPSLEKGADRLAETLKAFGVTTAFGLPGVHNLPIWTSFRRHGIRIVGVRHEQTAAYAADGYARATGRLGVAVVTTGPGAANTLAATGEAYTVGSPVLIIATDIATDVRRQGVFRGALHECRDQAGMFAPVTKLTVVPETADTLGTATKRAVLTALEAPSRPVYLGIPIDVLSGPAPTAVTVQTAESGRCTPTPTNDELRSACELVEAAQHPLVWVGGGAVASGCGAQVATLAARIGAPVLTTYGAKGIVGTRDRFLVTVPPQVPRVESELWNQSDLVISIGSDFDAMTTRAWKMRAPHRHLALNVDPADAAKNYPADQVLAGDASETLARLLPMLKQSGSIDTTAELVKTVNEEVWAEARSECPEAVELLDALTNAIPKNTNLVIDMCVAGYWVGGFCRTDEPRRLAYPVGWGTLGFSVPASIGTAMAGTGHTVVICGDGGFLYAPGELATIVQEQLAITIVVVDDGGYGMLRFAQDAEGARNDGVDLITPDFAALAKSFGITTSTVDGLGTAFADALSRAVGNGRPHLIWATAKLLPPPNTSTRSAMSLETR